MELLMMRMSCLIMYAVLCSSTVHGPMCLHCESMPQPRHCHTVAQCKADEVCATERSPFTQLYWLGCVKQSTCQRPIFSNDSSLCYECCSSDLCNAQACGEPGYPASRGPVCYDCEYHNEQHPCTKIDICSVNEECSVIQKEEFGDIILTSGCKSHYDCNSANPDIIVGKRSELHERSSSHVVCKSCCSKDLCNLNCNSSLFHCSAAICNNHGTCNNFGRLGYNCTCDNGWSGQTCELKQPVSCSAAVCNNHGTCNNYGQGGICTCDAGWTGLACESSIRAFDCLDILQRGLGATDGIYKIRLNSSGEEIDVFCDMTTAGGGWTVFQKRFNGSVDFYRNFSDYESGFGSLSGEFWLGLKYVYSMTANARNELRLDLENAAGSTAYETYQNFTLSSAPRYTLHIGQYSGTAGDGRNDGLSHNNGNAFSTYDKDQGPISGDCAVYDHGGWWYGYCTNANLNGYYVTPGTVSSYAYGTGGVIFRAWMGFKSLKATEMKFRRQ